MKRYMKQHMLTLLLVLMFTLVACAPASGDRADIPAPVVVTETVTEGIQGDSAEEDGYGVDDDVYGELSSTEAVELYQSTLEEVQDKLGKLPIDDSVPSGEFSTDRYSIESEALSEAQDALWDRQGKQDNKAYKEQDKCNEIDGYSDADMAAYDACYEAANREYDKLMKQHDEENDWLDARMNQLY